MMGYSREYLRGRSISVQEFDIFNPRRAFIVFSGLGSKAIKRSFTVIGLLPGTYFISF